MARRDIRSRLSHLRRGSWVSTSTTDRWNHGWTDDWTDDWTDWTDKMRGAAR